MDKRAQETLKKLESIDNMINDPKYDLNNHQRYQVEIKVNNKVPHGKFIPDKQHPGRWFASEQTYKAMKKDLFAGSQIDETEHLHTCHSCNEVIDLQFWNLCPHCLSEIKHDH